ncbi:MAG: hypothetical protein JSR42_13825 [Proteobacteria bacterium]|nr:hypothetical protein [Pseudomonadota bacterium]MBS0552903.1 hypothetical protein [Pseudomonadota bacterium]
MLCPHCADGQDRQSAHRAHVLQLLALIEHPTALPPDAALRIACELLAWTGLEASDCGCDHSDARVAEFETAV